MMAEDRVRIVVAAGPRAAEEVVLGAIEASRDAARTDLAALARPMVVVVPSRSLREHLIARAVAQLGNLAGVEILTLPAVAHRILRRSGGTGEGGGGVVDGSALVPLLIRRLARREPLLARSLEGLDDGYAAVAPAVNDLLDAGMEQIHVEPILEQIEATELAVARDRAAAVVRTAAAVDGALESLGRSHRSGLFREARDALRSGDAPAIWLAHETWIHGYADATGTQADLLEELLRASGGGWVFDAPPNPAEPGRPDSGVAYLERLTLRAAGFGKEESVPALAPPEIRLFRAPGIQAECREVAERVAALFEAGVSAERIGVVARDLGPYALALRAQLDRVGVPYSGGPGSAAGILPVARRARALVALLRDGAEATVDRWLDADDAEAPALRRDVRLALHSLGRVRIGQVADLGAEKMLGEGTDFPLPVRRGLTAMEDEDGGEAGLVAPRRRVSRDALRQAALRAAALGDRFRAWPREAPLRVHLAQLRELLARDLVWSARTRGAAEVREVLDALEEQIGAEFELSFEELRVVCDRGLRDVGAAPLGGAGGGIAVLSATEARARTFAHIFVVGVNRDLFPRAMPDDPLLPDALRHGLEWGVLPDIPIKRRGYDEERYLFAQLCAASAQVTVSWVSVSDDGKEKAPSPFAERLRLAAGVEEVERSPQWLDERERPLPPDEAAALAGLQRDRALQRELLELAFAPVVERTDGGVRSADWARARVAVSTELDGAHPSRDLGPYLGFIGPGVVRGPAPVTHLERFARCGWQTFLQRTLRVEALPDAGATLPDLSAAMLGNLVHRTLEEIVVAAGGSHAVAIGAAGPPVDVPLPANEEWKRRLGTLAATLLEEEGVYLPGLARVLAARAERHLERVFASDWSDGVARNVLGAELEGAATVRWEDGAEGSITFRVDRVDAGPVLTDYKTGKPISEAKDLERRQRSLLDATGDGTWLQAATYLLGGGETARARYLFAQASDLQAIALSSDGIETALRQRGAKAAAGLLRARDAGAFVPRLVTADGLVPRACGWCEVRDACLQHDTGARHRVLDWIESPGPEPCAAERAFLAVWKLGESSEEGAGSEGAA